MTDYKVASACIEELKEICSELLNAKEEEVFNKLSLYDEFEEKIKKIQPIITRIRIRRNETNEEKKIYGEKMIKNVDVLLERFDILYNIYEEELTVFKENYEIEKNKRIEKKLLEEKEKENNEKELLNRGRIKTQLEQEEILKKNLEKENLLKKEQEEYNNKMNRIETMKTIIKEKCSFLYDEISNACNKYETIKYIYTQLNGNNVNINNIYTNIINDNENELLLNNSIYFIDCIYMIYKNNEFKLFKEALKNLIEYLEELVKNIDNQQLKLINLMNKTFQKNILSKKGILFLFILIGFVLKKTDEILPILKNINTDINNENIYIYLEEPNITTNYDQWILWFQHIQKCVTILCTFFRHIHKFSDIPDDEKIKSIFLYLKEKFSNEQNVSTLGT
ncbi:conserved Plasmodium protein, unknown function [Plasmodium sp. gorilla clade G2]|uniref:conserved Plasmodium protein, unknown function n=1 Tax=Plasmodium sp. gorilla clade G2 TaxID=880535 RepID=UPI000D223DAC|nr:conserved Plasmodium protein, unknown function [Plasmodium sp. gorilla clade G2]SOV17850.1 conserved Plasmodium protein, unknown function [Plasmodium sp. gorilla clade G2]